MKVILRKDHESLGKLGAHLEVKDGYARNYLIPQGLAYPAAPNYEKLLQAEQKLVQKRISHQMKGAEELAKKLAEVTLITHRKAGEEGRLFGSVTAQDIADLLQEQGIELDRRKIVLDEAIKLLGTYQVRVHLHDEINSLLQVSVLKEE